MPKDSSVASRVKSAAWQRPLWFLTLIAASVIFSLGFACAVPLAGFAAVAALTADRKEALALTFAAFLANQLIGFTMLHYPWDASTLGWGCVLGLVSIAAVLAAAWTAHCFRGVGRLFAGSAAFLAAFVAYEGLLFVATIVSGSDFENYAASIVGRIFLLNIAGFLGLLALHRLAVMAGVADRESRALATHGSI